MRLKPKMGIVFTSIEGIDADQSKLFEFRQKSITSLNLTGLENVIIDFTVSSEDLALKANKILAERNPTLSVLWRQSGHLTQQ